MDVPRHCLCLRCVWYERECEPLLKVAEQAEDRLGHPLRPTLAILGGTATNVPICWQPLHEQGCL